MSKITERERGINVNKKYKIAVMGESNVGKTVFFGSYFHQSTDMGRAKYTVAIKSQESDDKITEIITQLFEKRQVVAGTDVRVDFSFSVDALGMDIELADLPGGFTTNRNYWDAEEVRKDLQDADWVLFFISADDVINRPAEAFKVNRAFADAISEIRRPQSSDLKGRADVPIWFIFTKGDTVPEFSVDELKSRVPSLIDAAKSQQVKGNWFARKIYRKGGYVRPYKTQAMGTWQDSNTPPADFNPVNVIEPMDELFEAMYESKATHISLFVKILGVLAVMAVIGAESFAFWVDREYFDSAKSRIEHLRDTNKYAESIREIDAYHPPFTSAIIPGIFRKGSELKPLREAVYRLYEDSLYQPIAAEISKVSDSRIPELDEVFTDTIRKVEEYLATTHFAQINPEHYARVRGSAWFFEAVKLFNIDPAKGEMSPDDEFEVILRCLNYEAPETWRDRIQSRIDNLLRHWGRTSPAEGDPANLEPYIDRASQLVSHPNLSQEVAGYLTERIDAWRREQAGRWQRIGESWVREAYELEPEEGLDAISAHMAGKIPPEVRTMLEDASSNIYNTIAESALQKHADNTDALRRLLTKYPAMTDSAKNKLTARIDFLREQMLEAKAREIISVKSINALAAVTKDLGEDVRTPAISRAVSSVLHGLTTSRLQEIAGQVSMMAGNNNYSEAKQTLSTETAKLRQEVLSVMDDTRINALISEQAGKSSQALMSAHYDYCKSSFNSRRGTSSNRDVTACLNDARKYVQTWPESIQTHEGDEVRQAVRFLEAVQGGIAGRLVVVEGYFKEADSITDTPDMKILITIGNDTWETETITDKVNPQFNAGISIRWNVEMRPVTFRGIEVDPMFDDEVFSYTVYPGGMKGYELLTRTLRNNGHSLTIHFQPSEQIPRCPW